eukprot:TRINITY_DN2791_c0_g1_i3.p1 TRINITY_DN2791_c0_g1~~TRINITY_DN2791_c0_g1_i3.p1  ORF type:complete len:859 (+),score=236.37 TRINITY_DN2791_c0_g1_i3:149-2725(+)
MKYNGTDSFMRSKMGGRHTIKPEEKRSIVEHINMVLSHDENLSDVLPLDPASNDVFRALNTGILLAKLVEKTAPGSIDFRKIEMSSDRLDINKGGRLRIVNNLNISLDALREMGCKIVNVSAEDIMRGEPTLIMGILWQIVQKGLSLQMEKMLERSGLATEETQGRTEREILLLWMNKHLTNAGYPKTISTFSGDISDGKAYAMLLEQLAPKSCPSKTAMKASTDLERAHVIMASAKLLGCDKFVKPEDIVSGNANLNFAFVANLFKESVNFPDEGPPPGNDASHIREEKKKKQKDIKVIENDPRDARIAELEKMVESFKSAEAEKKNKRKKEQEDLHKRIRELEDDNARLLADLAEARRGSDLGLEKMEREMKEAQKSLEVATRKLRDHEAEAEGKADEMESISRGLREAEERTREVEEERRRLKEESDAQVKSLTRQVQGLETDNERLTATVDELDGEIKGLKANEWVRKLAEKEKADSYLKVTYESVKKDSIIEGFLMKQANRGKKWKSRYFVLTDTYLFYFINPKSNKGCKYIRMKKAAITQRDPEGKQKFIAMITPKQAHHDYLIDFPSDETMKNWLTHMLKVSGTDLQDASVENRPTYMRKSWFGRPGAVAKQQQGGTISGDRRASIAQPPRGGSAIPGGRSPVSVNVKGKAKGKEKADTEPPKDGKGEGESDKPAASPSTNGKEKVKGKGKGKVDGKAKEKGKGKGQAVAAVDKKAVDQQQQVPETPPTTSSKKQAKKEAAAAKKRQLEAEKAAAKQATNSKQASADLKAKKEESTPKPSPKSKKPEEPIKQEEVAPPKSEKEASASSSSSEGEEESSTASESDETESTSDETSEDNSDTSDSSSEQNSST